MHQYLHRQELRHNISIVKKLHIKNKELPNSIQKFRRAN
jgi:hypothetical protein